MTIVYATMTGVDAQKGDRGNLHRGTIQVRRYGEFRREQSSPGLGGQWVKEVLQEWRFGQVAWMLASCMRSVGDVEPDADGLYSGVRGHGMPLRGLWRVARLLVSVSAGEASSGWNV